MNPRLTSSSWPNLNPTNETGNKIGAIENLGATQNQFDAIDLSDNEVVKLEGFPPLTRLHTLLLNNNRIARVGKNLEQQLPMLSSLILTNNRLTNLADVDPLAGFKHLKHLSVMGNPVTKKANYRLYVVFRLPHLKTLDFRKVGGCAQAESSRDVQLETAWFHQPFDLKNWFQRLLSQTGRLAPLRAGEAGGAREGGGDVRGRRGGGQRRREDVRAREGCRGGGRRRGRRDG
jgi:hypothetical protein